jgi:hypothetical protein
MLATDINRRAGATNDGAPRQPTALLAVPERAIPRQPADRPDAAPSGWLRFLVVLLRALSAWNT